MRNEMHKAKRIRGVKVSLKQSINSCIFKIKISEGSLKILSIKIAIESNLGLLLLEKQKQECLDG